MFLKNKKRQFSRFRSRAPLVFRVAEKKSPPKMVAPWKQQPTKILETLKTAKQHFFFGDVTSLFVLSVLTWHSLSVTVCHFFRLDNLQWWTLVRWWKRCIFQRFLFEGNLNTSGYRDSQHISGLDTPLNPPARQRAPPLHNTCGNHLGNQYGERYSNSSCYISSQHPRTRGEQN